MNLTNASFLCLFALLFVSAGLTESDSSWSAEIITHIKRAAGGRPAASARKSPPKHAQVSQKLNLHLSNSRGHHGHRQQQQQQQQSAVKHPSHGRLGQKTHELQERRQKKIKTVLRGALKVAGLLLEALANLDRGGDSTVGDVDYAREAYWSEAGGKPLQGDGPRNCLFFKEFRRPYFVASENDEFEVDDIKACAAPIQTGSEGWCVYNSSDTDNSSEKFIRGERDEIQTFWFVCDRQSEQCCELDCCAAHTVPLLEPFAGNKDDRSTKRHSIASYYASTVVAKKSFTTPIRLLRVSDDDVNPTAMATRRTSTCSLVVLSILLSAYVILI